VNPYSYCVFPRLDIDKFIADADYAGEITKLVELGVGGFCVFGRVTKEHAMKIIRTLQNMRAEPIIFAADFENGLPMRLLEGTAFPHAMALGKTDDHKLTFVASQLIGKEASSLGINWIFGPVCDINSNPQNPVINIRSFSEDKETVALHTSAYARGLAESEVMSCGKHFPGHGDTSLDSHQDLPVLDKSLEEMQDFELEPFRKVIANGVDSVMMGHLLVPSIDKEMPTSLSKKAIGLLKNDLGFSGIIITDALEMGAISKKYSSAEASELALKAGNHIALMPEDSLEAISHLKKLYDNDREFQKILDNNLSFLQDKFKLISEKKPFYSDKLKDEYLQHEKVALRIARLSTELKIKKVITPIDEDARIAVFAFLQRDEDFAKASMFYNLLASAIENDMDAAFIDENISPTDLQGMKEGTQNADIYIFCYYYKGRAFAGNLALADRINNIKEYLTGKSSETINIFFGDPYQEPNIEGDMSILTYSDSLASLASSVMVLSGRDLPTE
jgi:beta-glucosidase-like glycosyl hydrolase